jgi:hypothetical protein
MTSVSACKHMHTSICGASRVDTQQDQEQIGATKRGKGSVCPWQPRPQEGYVDIQTSESRMGLADTHQ